MIAVRLNVPIACWRKAHAREFLETESIPPPSTCYGALLSLVGETDRERHRGCRVTAGIVGRPHVSVVVRTLWKIKDTRTAQGVGENAKLDLQQLATGCEVILWCDSREDRDQTDPLEARVTHAFTNPEEIDRAGGWSLGESTHLINDAELLIEAVSPPGARVFLLDPEGTFTLPVWVDHVGMAGTVYVVGRLTELEGTPRSEQLPQIP